jgi:choline-sulfatase
MSGDLSQDHPTYTQALQQAGYHTSGIGKFHWLQGWRWGTDRGKGHDLVGLKEDMKRYGFDYIWEAAGKQLAKNNYCDYGAYLESKGLLDTYRDFVQSGGKNIKAAEEQACVGQICPVPEEDYVDIVIGDKIVEAIGNRPADKPFFIFGSFLSPHPPFDPPQAYMDRVNLEEEDDFVVDVGARGLSAEAKERLYSIRQAYKALVLLIDDQIGKVFRKLEQEQLLEETIIVFVSDHGEMLGDHGIMAKQSPYWQSATVPAAIRHPDYLSRKVAAAPVEIIDLTATILDMAGINPEQALSKDWPSFHNIVPCKSLMPIITGEGSRIKPYAFSECQGQWQSVQNEKYKYVRYLKYKRTEWGAVGPVELFYSLQDDPDERINRIHDSELAEEVQRCRTYRDYIMDTTPPAQHRWAPVLDEAQPL